MQGDQLNRILKSLGLAVAVVSSALALGQQAAPHFHGPLDQDVPAPASINSTASSAVSGEQLLATYASALLRSPWRGIQATGTIRYSESDTGYPVSYTVSPEGYEQLAVTRPNGTMTSRTCGYGGVLIDEHGDRAGIPLRNAIVHLIPFTTLLSYTAATRATLVMGGEMDMGGDSYHRLSALYTPATRTDVRLGRRPQISTDFYLNSTSRTLYKSVDFIEGLQASPQEYIRVITYSAYQNVNGTAFPFEITQSLNGQKSFDIQLTSVEDHPSLQDICKQ